MQKIITVKDLDSRGQLAVSLIEILNTIDFIGDDFHWSILELDAMGKNVNYNQINEATKKDDYHLTWDQLKQLAEKFDQVINLILVAYKDGQNPIDNKNHQSILASYPIVIEIEDGDFWEIYTDIGPLIYHLEDKFKNAEVKKKFEYKS